MRSFIRQHFGALVLVITWIVFFSRTLFGGQLYFLDDLKILYYPIEQAYAQFQQAWQLPLWSPYFGFGQPLLAWGQLGFLTPLHFVLRFLPLHPVILLNISILAYFAVGLTGMFVFLRRQHLHQFTAALGALTFAFSGFMVGHLNHVNFTTATMLLPWLLLVIHTVVAAPTLPKVAVLSLLASAIPLSGQPQISVYTFAIATLYGAMLVICQGKRLVTDYTLRLSGSVFLAGIIALALASSAILPLSEFLPATDRADDLPTTELYEFSYPPTHAITLINPYYFGDHELYWGAKNFQELAAYVGIVPLLLAVIGLVVGRRNLAIYLTGILLIILALIFAPGSYSAIYRFLVENHILTSLAVPGRFVYFFDVGIALLAAIGLEAILRFHWFAQPMRGGVLGASLVLITASNLIWWGWNYNPLFDGKAAIASSPFTTTLQEYENTHGVPARLYSNASLPLSGEAAVPTSPTEPIGPLFTIHQSLRLGEGATCLAIPFELTTEALESSVSLSLRDQLGDAPFFVTNIVASDISLNPVQTFCPEQLASRFDQSIVITLSSDTNTTIQALQRLPAGDEEKALYVRVPNPTTDQLEQSRKTARLVISQDQTAMIDLEQLLLVRHLQTTAHASAARWAGALGIADYRAFIQTFFADDGPVIDGEGIHTLARYRNLVNLAGITHLAQSLPATDTAHDSVLANGYNLVQEAKQDNTVLRLYENPNALPKAFLVGTAIWESGADQTRFGLRHPDFDGRRLVYISGPTPPTEGTLPNTELINHNVFSRDVFDQGDVSITTYEPTRVDIAVSTNDPAWLVLNDSFTPQWQTYIDGAPAPQYVANSVFRTAYVPAGNHTISFQYHSPAATTSLWLTVAGLIASGLLLSVQKFRVLFSR